MTITNYNIEALTDHGIQHGKKFEKILYELPKNLQSIASDLSYRRSCELCQNGLSQHLQTYKDKAVDHLVVRLFNNLRTIKESGKLSECEYTKQFLRISDYRKNLAKVPAAKFNSSLADQILKGDLFSINLIPRPAQKQKGFTSRIRDKIYNFFEVQIQCFYCYDRTDFFIKFILLPAAVVTLSVVLWNVYKTVRDYYSRLNQPNPLLLPRCLKPCLNLNQNSLAFDSIAVACLPYFVRFNHKQRLLKYCYTTLN